MEDKKIYLDSGGSGYYGYNFSWEEAGANEMLGESDGNPSLETKNARLYTLAGVEAFIDELSDFIRPSVLLKFIKALEYADTGEKLYKHLQENVRYVRDLVDGVRKRGEINRSLALEDCVFGWHRHCDDCGAECHLAPFGDGNLMMKWLLPHDEFLAFFKKELAKRNNKMFAVAYNTQEVREQVVKEIEARIRFLEDQKKDIDREIKIEKGKMEEVKP